MIRKFLCEFFKLFNLFCFCIAPASSTLSIGDVLITNSADAPVYYTLQEVGPAASVSKNVVRDFGGQAILSNPLGYSPIYSTAGLYIWGPQCAGMFVLLGFYVCLFDFCFFSM